jgi:hypothetical protein
VEQQPVIHSLLQAEQQLLRHSVLLVVHTHHPDRKPLKSKTSNEIINNKHFLTKWSKSSISFFRN